MYEESRQRMIRLARNFGFAALIFSFLFASFFPVIIGFACLSMVVAYLSKGNRPVLDKQAKAGVIAGIVAIVVSVSIFASGIIKLYNDAEYREQFISISEALYGDAYKELYGIDLDELFGSVFGGGTNE
ncbi:MAG: hypothetical protein K6E19_03070 [Lachnospiraceae bacterium]|nr:hypothetical protein [Lachnospiraceae bacterium]